jgi:hypothetical protein
VSLLGPTTPFPNHLFTFDGVLSSRPLRVTVSRSGVSSGRLRLRVLSSWGPAPPSTRTGSCSPRRAPSA